MSAKLFHKILKSGNKRVKNYERSTLSKGPNLKKVRQIKFEERVIVDLMCGTIGV